VAAHGSEKKRRMSFFDQGPYGSPVGLDGVPYAAAPGGDGDSRAGLQGPPPEQLPHLFAYHQRHVSNGRCLGALADLDEPQTLHCYAFLKRSKSQPLSARITCSR